MHIITGLILFVTIFSLHTQHAASFEPQKRQPMAQAILQKPFTEQEALSLYYRFKFDRNQIKQWFNEHAQLLQEYIDRNLPQRYRAKVKIVLGGSYYWKTNHMLSDIDALMVIDTSNAYEYDYIRNRITSLLYNFYYMQCWRATTFVRYPKPNLPVFKIFNYSDKQVQDIRIDIGFKTAAEYTAMIRDERQAFDAELGKDRIQRVSYACAMMCATYCEDFSLKKRIRIVPAWERELMARAAHHF